jgi:hypothetical protein
MVRLKVRIYLVKLWCFGVERLRANRARDVHWRLRAEAIDVLQCAFVVGLTGFRDIRKSVAH